MRPAVWAAALCCLVTSSARAQDDDSGATGTPSMSTSMDDDQESAPAPSLVTGDQAEAKRLYASGAELYEEGNYELAIKAFREAYELSDRHPLLMNIANAHERLGELQLAIDSLNEYRIYADDETKEKLERRIRVLEQRLAEAGPRPSGPADPVETGPEMQPNPLKWVVLGTGGAIAAGFGAVTYASYNSGQNAVTANDQAAYDSARSLNTVAGAITGIGGALVVVGMALPAERPVSISPMPNGVRFGLRF